MITNNKKVIGITCSTFDLLHTGHILMLEECKKYCNYLICALQVDPTIDRPNKNKPIQSIDERRIQLESIKYVDKIIEYDTEEDLHKICQKIKPHIRILGSDYRDKQATGQQFSDGIIYHERDHSWSTTELRKRISDS